MRARRFSRRLRDACSTKHSSSPLALCKDIRARINQLREHIDTAREDLAALYHCRSWLVLGYDFWDELCEYEFDGVRIRLTIEDRREVVSELRQEGLSTRAIASAVGVSDQTIRADLNQVRELTQLPNTITGLDGKTRPASNPPHPRLRRLSTFAR